MSESHIFVIVIMCIGCCYTMDGRCQTLCCFPDQKMHMICHQTIGIDVAAWWKMLPKIINRINYIPQDRQKPEIVFTVFKDVLPVSTSQHDVVDTSSTYFSWFTSHNIKWKIRSWWCKDTTLSPDGQRYLKNNDDVGENKESPSLTMAILSCNSVPVPLLFRSLS